MKIKTSIIGKLNKLTACEWQLFEFLIRRMEETSGQLQGLYYRDVISETGMCRQSFYNALRGLADKKVITSVRNSDIDYDITIIDNAFPWKGTTKETYGEGYINLSRPAFRSKKWRRMKPHEKYLTLEFLKRTHEGRGSFKQNAADFSAKWQKALSVSRRVFTGYLHTLKAFFSIGRKDGMCYVTYMHSVWDKGMRRADEKPEAMYCYEQIIRTFCNRHRISYDRTALKETAEIIPQYRQRAGGLAAVCGMIGQAIAEAAAKTAKKERFLRPPQIGYLMKLRIRNT